jgi:hypothetical protein
MMRQQSLIARHDSEASPVLPFVYRCDMIVSIIALYAHVLSLLSDFFFILREVAAFFLHVNPARSVILHVCLL